MTARVPTAIAVCALAISVLIEACGGGGPGATPSSVATSTPRPEPTLSIESFETITEGPVPGPLAASLHAALEMMAGPGGISATVMTDRGTWSEAIGTADGVHDVVVESQFGIGSVTKSLVAAQVMQLVEAGEVSLDEPASHYLPAGFSFDTNRATIRQLLGHLSGIPDWFTKEMQQRVEVDRLHVWTTDEVLGLIGTTRRPPGSTFEYADTNYNVLGLVIEHVRKEPLIDVLRAGVLRVDGTERLIYQPDERPSDPMAMPLGESSDALVRGGGYLPSISDASSAGPAGAMASDSISLARWWRAFCAGHLVSPASLNEMANFVVADGSDGYGLGLFNPADPWGWGIGHTGGNFGYSSWAGCMPGDRPSVVVVLTTFPVDDLGELPRPLVMATRSG